MIYMMGLHFDVVAILPRSKIPFYTIRNKNADNYVRDRRVLLLYISFEFIEIFQTNFQKKLQKHKKRFFKTVTVEK